MDQNQRKEKSIGRLVFEFHRSRSSFTGASAALHRCLALTSITRFNSGWDRPKTTIRFESLLVGRVPLPPPLTIHKKLKKKAFPVKRKEDLEEKEEAERRRRM
ncbi:hypothetical protein QN277_019793 [Acacia crassicarpa]|uniref:Uncharacterized protein n=1 Tax=Acacia crassicarpa TaxID=499986 RepID=A0AAE1JIF1_9FABA|nr:hypothetical protein QN277_019793 [Acacia crassicarpa]